MTFNQLTGTGDVSGVRRGGEGVEGGPTAGGFVSGTTGGSGVMMPGGAVPGDVGGPRVVGGKVVGGGANVVPAGGVGWTGWIQFTTGCATWVLQFVHWKQRSWAEASVEKKKYLKSFLIKIFTKTLTLAS